MLLESNVTFSQTIGTTGTTYRFRTINIIFIHHMIQIKLIYSTEPSICGEPKTIFYLVNKNPLFHDMHMLFMATQKLATDISSER
jgi:hypothetical protein